MISVNQEIGTSVPQKVEKGGARNVSYQGGPLNDGGEGGGGGLKCLMGLDTVEDIKCLFITLEEKK